MELTNLKIELIDQRTVKITLNEDDLDEMALSFHDMEESGVCTRQTVLGLISKIKDETSLDLTGSKLFIEAFPDANGGCVLYVNLIDRARGKIQNSKPETPFNTPLVFRFDGLTPLLDSCERLFAQYSHLVRKSSLFLLDQSYYLAICSYLKADEKLTHLLSEYGRFFGKGEIKLSFLKEHAACIVEDTAVETLADYAC